MQLVKSMTGKFLMVDKKGGIINIITLTSLNFKIEQLRQLAQQTQPITKLLNTLNRTNITLRRFYHFTLSVG